MSSKNRWFINIPDMGAHEYYYIFCASIPVNVRSFVYANTYKLTDIENATIRISNKDIKYIVMQINPLCLSDIEAEIYGSFDASAYDNYMANPLQYDSSLSTLVEIKYEPSLLGITNGNYKNANKLISDNASYQLLRVNPKLTGNIKLVITSNNDMYLDTFKVSDSLSRYKYRHLKVGSEHYYGTDIMNSFKDLPSDDIYKIKDSCYNLFTTVQGYNMQYDDTYNCGVRTNTDKLYSENFALLAPLCVKNIIPDFFLIFKVNTEGFKQELLSESDKISYFFNHGKIVKSYDMRDTSDLGKYIRKIYNNTKSTVGDAFISYDENNYNKFIGISLDRGVITSAYESVFDERNITNQTALNDFYTLGFERNRLVSKDIVNLEFMFNDLDEQLFSLTTYFGAYVKLNGESATFTCIGYDDDNHTYIYDASIHCFDKNTNIGIDSSYGKYLYGISTPNEFIRLDRPLISNEINDKYKLTPYQNILTSHIKVQNNMYGKSFISMQIKRPLDVGEHFRVIDKANHKIYEVICSNYEYCMDNNHIGEVSYNRYDTSLNETWQINRVNIFIKFRDDIDSTEWSNVCIDETSQLSKAFEKFDNFIVSQCNDNILYITATNTNVIFERITSSGGYTGEQKEQLKNDIYESSSVTYFNDITIPLTILELRHNDPLYTDWTASDMFYLYPLQYEVLGNRSAQICKFIDLQNTTYHVNNKNIGNINNYTVLYKRTDINSEYTLYNPFNVQYYKNDASFGIISSDINTNYIMSYKYGYYLLNITNPLIINSSITLYNNYPLNTGICSIFNVKDYYYDILDTDNNISDIDSSEVIGYSGEYNKLSVFDTTIRKTSEEDIRNIFDKTKKYDDDFLNNAVSRNTFYKNLVLNKNTKSNISMITPYCCKWRNLGTDARGDNLRVMYDFDASTLYNTLSYYIPYEDSSINPDIKYKYYTKLGYNIPSKISELSRQIISLDSSGNSIIVDATDKDDYYNYTKYIQHSINDVVNIDTNVTDNSSVSTGIYAKKYIVDYNGTIDNILYGKYNYDNRESIVCNSGNNIIEFISGGLKFRISSKNDDIINFNNYVGYTASFINIPDINVTHLTPTELIIDEINRQILLIWYNNTGLLSKTPFVQRLFNKSIVADCQCLFDNARNINRLSTYILTPNDAKLTIDASNNSHLFMCSNQFAYNSTSYTDFKNLILLSKLDASSYTADKSAYKSYNPIFWFGSDNVNESDASSRYINDSLLDRYSNGYYDSTELLLLTKDISTNIPYTERTIDDLKNDILSCGIYIKKYTGGKDYTKLNNILNLSIIKPIKYSRKNTNNKVVSTGFVHSGFITPVLKNMFIFDYAVDDDICNIFEYNFNGANISVKTAQYINQHWFNKYTNDINFCIPTDDGKYRLSLGYKNNVSIFNNCWSPELYREYYIDSSNYERFNSIYGYLSGYEINTFINSRGLNLNSYEGDNLTIDTWRNTNVFVSDGYIKLNVTDSIIYTILTSSGYSKNWDSISITSNEHKLNYIKNYIMNFINIDNYSAFTIYRNLLSSGLNFTNYPVDSTVFKKVENCKNELKYEDGKYYMYIYPKDKCTYYAKLNIKFNGK